MSEIENQAKLRLEELPLDALACLMRHISRQDMLSLMLCSKTLSTALSDDRLFYVLCSRTFGHKTNIAEWIVSPPSDNPSSSSTPTSSTNYSPYNHYQPTSYRDLYALLLWCNSMIGIWSTDDPLVASGCITFNWSQDGLLAEEVHISSLNNPIKRLPYKVIRPSSGSIDTLIETIDKDNALMASQRYTTTNSGGGGLMIQRYPSEVEESAAAVALGSSFGSITSTGGGGGTPLLGSSPQGSFKDSFLKFMSNNVQPRSKQRRSTPLSRARQKFHLKRIELPRRAMMMTTNSRKNSGVHPLAGLFIADCPDGSVQLMNLQYTFSSYPAKVEGKRVDRCLPGEGGMVVNLTYLVKDAAPWNVPAGVGDDALLTASEMMQDYKEILQEILLESDLASLLLPNDEEDGGGEGTNNINNVNEGSTTTICDGPYASVSFSDNDELRNHPFPGILYFLGEDKTDPKTKLVIIGPLRTDDAFECIFFRRVCIDEIISSSSSGGGGDGGSSSRSK